MPTPYGAAAGLVPWKILFYAVAIAVVLHVLGVYTLADWVAAFSGLFGGILDGIENWIRGLIGEQLP